MYACLKYLCNFYNELVSALQNFMINKKKGIDFLFSNKIVKAYQNGRKIITLLPICLKKKCKFFNGNFNSIIYQ